MWLAWTSCGQNCRIVSDLRRHDARVTSHQYVSFYTRVSATSSSPGRNMHTVHITYNDAWWRHQMEAFSALLAICVGISPVSGEFPTQRPVTRSFDVFFDLRLNKRLSKQSWGWWFETPSGSLWRHSNELPWAQISYNAFQQVTILNAANFLSAPELENDVIIWHYIPTAKRSTSKRLGWCFKQNFRCLMGYHYNKPSFMIQVRWNVYSHCRRCCDLMF